MWPHCGQPQRIGMMHYYSLLQWTEPFRNDSWRLTRWAGPHALGGSLQPNSRTYCYLDRGSELFSSAQTLNCTQCERGQTCPPGHVDLVGAGFQRCLTGYLDHSDTSKVPKCVPSGHTPSLGSSEWPRHPSSMPWSTVFGTAEARVLRPARRAKQRRGRRSGRTEVRT